MRRDTFWFYLLVGFGIMILGGEMQSGIIMLGGVAMMSIASLVRWLVPR